MVDIIISGEAGKLHAVYHKSAVEAAPLAVILSGNPRQKYHMNDRVSYAMFRAFMDIGFSVVRFNYRGVGDSEGVIGTTSENMLDIATVIDWIQNHNEDSDKIWLAGHQLGAWYVLQAMMRRPEISGFALVSPDASVSDFAFLSPRPNRGLLLQGAAESDDARASSDSAAPCNNSPRFGRGDKNAKSDTEASGDTNAKPEISGRRIIACKTYHAPN